MSVTAERLPGAGAVLSQARAENFPVALKVLGPRLRRHLTAIYGFARLVDDIGDEYRGDRTAQLDWVDAQLEAIYGGGVPEHSLLQALASSIRECGLPRTAFARLVEANRWDQRISRYETFDELLAYCALSAAPVGELVLHVFGCGTPERIALSDRVCAGLQVVEHLQDVREDHARGRIYLPQADLRHFGCEESALAGPETSPGLRALIAFEIGRADRLLDAGAPLARSLRGRARLAVAGFVAGGRAALRGIEKSENDVCAQMPRRDRKAFAIALLRAVAGR